MPWQEQTTMALRQEFCRLAEREGANLSELCRRYGISRPTAYTWLARWQAEGAAGLRDRSHRPLSSPHQTDLETETRVLALRDAHPSWGGRKLRQALLLAGATEVPAASTITAIVRRGGRALATRPDPPATQRFEAPCPNDLWQMDFKGHVALAQGRLHPLVVEDDHSRLVLGLFACANEQGATVQPHLITLFERYGLPRRLLCDNGPPWGAPQGDLTTLSAWLVRLGITVLHGRPRHPQTQGKLERVNRTLGAEVLTGRLYADLVSAQTAFDGWRDCYNQERPHDALGGATPLSRYQLSDHPYPGERPPLTYEPGDHERRVSADGKITFRGTRYYVSRALQHETVAVRGYANGGHAIYFGSHRVRELKLPEPV